VGGSKKKYKRLFRKRMVLYRHEKRVIVHNWTITGYAGGPL
jgi:hypothetical protein